MPSKDRKPGRKGGSAELPGDVDRYMAVLEHPCKEEIQALRKIICGADRTIAEAIKWNVPSFCTTEFFATTHLRAKTGVGVVLHLGAKVRKSAQPQIDDPDGMLKWLGKDRAMVTFAGMDEVRAGKQAFERIIRQWIKFV